MRFATHLWFIAAAGALPLYAPAQTFPSRPVELVVHTGPGAGADRVARIIADILTREQLLRQPVTVTNKNGGAGAVTFNYIKSKRGDPHVILASVSNTLVSASLRPEFGINLDQFTPLAMLAQDPQAVIVSTHSPWHTFKDLIDAAKRDPGVLVTSIGSPTSAGRMLLYMIEQETGAKFKVVSMKSGAEALIAVMGGHTQLSTENVSEGMPAIESRKLRVLAVSSARRMAAVPNTPTLNELGYHIHIGSARGLAMPAGVPRQAVEHMEAALYRVYLSAAWKAHAQSSHYENVWMGSAEFTRYLQQRQTWVRDFLRDIGAVAKP
jgi:putative tricarboxylic transport membrane protein